MIIPAVCVLLASISLVTGIAVYVRERKIPGKEIGGFLVGSAALFAWFLFVV